MFHATISVLQRVRAAMAARSPLPDDAGQASQAVIIVGLVGIALAVVAAVNAFTNDQLSILGG